MRLTLRCVLKSVLPPIDRCRGGQSCPPLRGGATGMRSCSGRGDAPQGYLLRCVGIAPYERTRGAVVKWTAG